MSKEGKPDTPTEVSTFKIVVLRQLEARDLDGFEVKSRYDEHKKAWIVTLTHESEDKIAMMFGKGLEHFNYLMKLTQETLNRRLGYPSRVPTFLECRGKMADPGRSSRKSSVKIQVIAPPGVEIETSHT